METAQYLDVFIDESTEHLDTLYKQLLELENHPSKKSVIEEIFRAAHTIKGMSATMGYQDLANLTHYLENVFDGVRYGKIAVNVDMIDVLFQAVDHLNAMVEDIADGGDGKRDIGDVVNYLERIENGEMIGQIVERKQVPQQDQPELTTSVTTLDEFELAILKESTEQGYFNYEITVQLREECLLKGARVFMVFDVLEKLGEVIKSEPSVNDLEEENFDYKFTVILVSKHLENDIDEKVNTVSEIDNVSVKRFSTTHESIGQEPGKKNSEESKKTVSKGMKQAPRKTIRVNIDRLDVLMNLFEELVIDRGRLEQISLELNNNDLQETVERMARVSGDLQNIILNMRMMPIESVFSRFPNMIRQLARELHKNIDIEIVGADTELDRTVIDEIGDPLVHLIRNAIDHGIETPEERREKGKPEQGLIKLQAYQSGNSVFVEIKDDGAGINKEAVLNKAISNGILSKDDSEALTDQQIFELIMASGFSTAEKISDISGRGVGLDVVKNTIETLGGSITIDAKVDQGSTFSVQLPLTLSIISVLLIELESEKYAIPLSSIIETVIVPKDDVLRAHNKKVIDFRGNVIPLVFLKKIFSVSDQDEQSEYVSIVIVKKANKTAGLVVDSFIGQQEVVLKSLGKYLSNVPAISGATILGDGQVALIIDSNALIK